MKAKNDIPWEMPDFGFKEPEDGKKRYRILKNGVIKRVR